LFSPDLCAKEADWHRIEELEAVVSASFLAAAFPWPQDRPNNCARNRSTRNKKVRHSIV